MYYSNTKQIILKERSPEKILLIPAAESMASPVASQSVHRSEQYAAFTKANNFYLALISPEKEIDWRLLLLTTRSALPLSKMVKFISRACV